MMLHLPQSAFLHSRQSVDQAAELIQQGTIKTFLVVDNWRNPIGMLTAGQVLQALKDGKADLPVQELPLHPVKSVHEQSSLETIYQTLQQQQIPALVTFDHRGNATGLIDGYLLNQFIRQMK